MVEIRTNHYRELTLAERERMLQGYVEQGYGWRFTSLRNLSTGQVWTPTTFWDVENLYAHAEGLRLTTGDREHIEVAKALDIVTLIPRFGSRDSKFYDSTRMSAK